MTAYPRGAAVRIVAVDAGHGLRERLLALGLVPGAVAFILAKRHGPLTICVNNCRVALGHGIAARVKALPADAPICSPCPREPACPAK